MFCYRFAANLLTTACSLLLALSLTVSSPINLHAQAYPIKIMPLGNSITRGVAGSTNDIGYRRSLYLSLTNAGYAVDFVGNEADGIPTDFDRDHEGHGGWRADQLRDNVYNWLTQNPAEIILLHIGTNDISAGETAAAVAAEIGQILDNIDQYETDNAVEITVFLARIINRSEPTAPKGLETTALNNSIQTLADTRITNGDKIIVVDQENALIYPDDLADGVHPNDTGYEKMAVTWFAALDVLLQPEIANFLLSATSPDILITDDLICSYELAGTATAAATAWYKNGSPRKALYLPMEGGPTNSLLDYSGNNITATTHGDPAWNAAGGYDGFGAYEFDGNDDLSAGENFPTAASYTKSAWVYRTGDGDDNGNNIISGDENSGGHALWAPTAYDRKLSAGHNGTWNSVQDDAALALNTWYFVAVTFDDDLDEMILYKNGVEVDRATVSANVTDKTISIGSFGAGNGYMWKGKIDDVRIFCHALSANQISSLYNNGSKKIVSDETETGDQWQARVTPFSATEAGTSRLSNILTIQDIPAAPLIFSNPVTEAFVGQNYIYDVDASGNPAATYALTTHPTGMTINATTGLIEWLPTVDGDFDVIVEANNPEGTASQSFTINVQEASCLSGMTHYWKLDETSGSLYEDFYGANDATGANCPTPTTGIAGGAQLFDGNDDELNAADDGTFDWDADANFSIEYWMKTSESTSGNRVIVGRDDAGSNLHWWIGCRSDGTVNFQLRDNTGAGAGIGGGVVLNNDTWHLIVAVRDASADKNRIYVDGVKIDSITYDYQADFDGDAALNIGYLNTGGHYRYHGSLDEVATYDRALTGLEILTHYQAGQLGKGYCSELAPTIISTPITEATSEEPYRYNVEATGNPAPTYTLTTHPSGMTISAISGLIEWTPVAGGDFDVTLEASNSKGNDTQNFSIHVSQPPACPEGMAHYWKLDETSGPPYDDFFGATDATSNLPPTPTTGIVNGAQQFDGNADEINVPAHDSFNWDKDANFSIELWINKNSACSGSEIANNEVIIGRDGGGTNLHWWIGAWCSGSPQGAVIFQLRDENGNGAYVVGTSNLTDGNWHYIVAVRDENENKNRIYVDGVEENNITYDYTADFYSPGAALEIGHLHNGFYYEGIVDEIALYDRALSPTEIQQHYANGLNGVGYCEMQHLISGNVTYYFTGDGVRNTTMNLSGGSVDPQNTDDSGFYEFSTLPGDCDYQITPAKTGDVSGTSILMYDASVAARIAVELIDDPSENQRVAADVDKSGSILMYDASLIAMYAVGLPPNPESHAGNWLFKPGARSYQSLDADQTNQDYTAILLGDVDGNWSPPAQLAKASEIHAPCFAFDDLWGLPGEQLVIPISAEPGEVIYSCDIVFNYNPSILKFNKLRTTPISEHFQIAVNNLNKGSLRMGSYGTQPITKQDGYLELVFDIIGRDGAVSELELESYRINTGEAQSGSAIFTVGTNPAEIPKRYTLRQNYPNPFNPTTIIVYELANKEPQKTTIIIYNLRGEVIKTLLNTTRLGGRYKAAWDGTNAAGIPTSSGVYLCEIKSGSFKDVIKMTKVK